MFVTAFLGHQGWMIRSARTCLLVDPLLCENFGDIHALDRIDVEVDLNGHASGNRLMLFARKPAPAEVSYLGFVGTTGVAASDCRLTDAPRFARKVEAAYRNVGRRWCASTEAA